MAGDELDEIATFVVGERRRAGLRMIAVGGFALVPFLARTLTTGDLSLSTPHARYKFFAALLAVVGALLVAIGAVTVARARANIDPIIPPARVPPRRR